MFGTEVAFRQLQNSFTTTRADEAAFHSCHCINLLWDLLNNRTLLLFDLREALLQARYVACSHKRLVREYALLAPGFAGQQVVAVSLVTLNLASAGNFETVFQAAVRFHLRHGNCPP